MKTYMLLSVFVFCANLIFATEDKGIKMQIKSGGEVIFDTVIYENSAQARQTMEMLVEQFSGEHVIIDSRTVQGSYVFHMNNKTNFSSTSLNTTVDNSLSDNIKTPSSADELAQLTKELNMNAMDELSGELDLNEWNEVRIEIVVDSLQNALEAVGDAFYDLKIGKSGFGNVRSEIKNLINTARTATIEFINEE